MISPTAVETFGNEGIALNPIGTGPFKFVEREQGVKTVIERNPDYWGRKAKLDRVIFRPARGPRDTHQRAAHGRDRHDQHATLG